MNAARQEEEIAERLERQAGGCTHRRERPRHTNISTMIYQMRVDLGNISVKTG